MEPGRESSAIRRRMKELKISQYKMARIVGRSQTWVSKMLLENTQKTITKLAEEAPGKFERFLGALRWNLDEFISKTGIRFDGELIAALQKGAKLDHGKNKIIPVYRLADAVERKSAIMTTEIPNDWDESKIVALVAEREAGAGLFGTDCIVKVQLGAEIRRNDLVVVELQNKELLVRRFVVEQGDRLYLASGNGHTSEEVGRVLGLILRSEVVHAEPR